MGPLVFSILLMLFLPWTPTQADYRDVGLPITTSHTQDDFNAHYQNWCIKQGSDGLIYVCNGNGLLVWNGEQWQLYPTPNRSRIRAAAWHGGKLFVGTDNDLGFYHANAAGNLTFNSIIPADQNPQFGEVWSVVAQKDFVAFKATNALYTWDGDQLRLLNNTLSRGQLLKADDGLFIKARNDDGLYQVTATELLDTGLTFPPKLQPRTTLKLGDATILVTASDGLFTWNHGLIQALNNPFPDGAYVYDAWSGHDGHHYFASVTHGLFVLDNQFNWLRTLDKDSGLETNTITQVITDDQGVIWLSGSPEITQFHPPHHYAFYPSEGLAKVNFSATKINQHLYVLASNLLHLTPNEKGIPVLKPMPGYENIHWGMILLQADQVLIAGTGGVSLAKQLDNGRLERQEWLLSVNFAYKLLFDATNKVIYASTNEGLFTITPAGSGWEPQRVLGIDGEVRDMVMDATNHIWVGNSAGNLFMVSRQTEHQDAQLIRHFTQADGIGQNKVVPFELFSKARFGTNDGVMAFNQGVLEFVTEFPPIFTTPGQDVHLVVEADPNTVWYRIGSHSGRITKQAGIWQTNEHIFKPFPPRSINSFIPDGDALWFQLAGVGLYRLDQRHLDQLPKPGQLRISQVSNNDPNAPQYLGFGPPPALTYAHNHNSLRFEYALADHSLPRQSSYRTRLLGSQNDQWSDWSQETYLDLIQLRHGQYVFEVQAKDGWERLIGPVSLSLTIHPPWFLTTTAWLGYFVLMGLMIYWVAKRYAHNQHQKLAAENLKLDRLVKQKTQHLHSKAMDLELLQQTKDRFFTDFSHELRTPLSLIIAPLEKVNEKQPNHLLKVALNNAGKLKQQVNRIFDLQQLNDPVVRLNLSTVQLSAWLHEVTEGFQPWAEKHQQQLSLSAPHDSLAINMDAEKMAAVLSNLISNAIKYSGVGAKIQIQASGSPEQVSIDVSDDGPGIDTSEKDKVFERFYTSESDNISEQTSVGVGLPYAREIVEAHGGHLTLDTHGIGAHFNIRLPNQAPDCEVTHVSTALNPTINNDDHPSVVLVEDNDELRDVLLMILAEDFVVHEFARAQLALDQIETILPDGIISDVMMPGMNGIEFTAAVRQIEVFKTTPILLLTAKTAQQDVQLGLSQGATDYMTKPFSPGELKLRIINHINTVKSIRREFQHSKEPKAPLTTFLSKLNACLEELLPNGPVSIAQMAEQMAMDRTTLFRKIKKEAGLSPSQYILRHKLNKAAQILQTDHISISEVAYVVGFESLAYFSTCFKEQFRCTPSEYLKKQ